MRSRCLNANSKSDSRSNWARMFSSPSLSIALACPCMLLPRDSAERLSQGRPQGTALVPIPLMARSAPVLKSRPRTPRPHHPSVTVSDPLSSKSSNLLVSQMKKSPSSRTLDIGLNSSHLRDRRTWRSSVSSLTGEDLSSPLTLIHTTTLSSDGNSISWDLRRKSSLVRDTRYSLRMRSSHVLIMIDPRERELDLRNTLSLRSSVLISQRAWRLNLRERKFTLSLLPWDLRLCTDKPTATSFLKVNTVPSKWKMMSSSSAVNAQLETWPSKKWPRNGPNTPTCTQSRVKN